jgi:hypothetical protein
MYSESRASAKKNFTIVRRLLSGLRAVYAPTKFTEHGKIRVKFFCNRFSTICSCCKIAAPQVSK